MVYNPKNTGSTTSDGSIGRKCQKTVKIRKMSNKVEVLLIAKANDA